MAIGDQLLRNPDLKWTNGETESVFWQPSDGTTPKKVDMQHPDEWVYVKEHLQLRNQVPQSLHRDEGFNIATGYQMFHCGYEQSQIAVEGNTRAVFRMDYNLYLHAGRSPFGKLIIEGKDRVESDWTDLSGSREKLFPVHFLRSGLVTATMIVANATDASTIMDCVITGLSLEQVANDYGGDAVKKVMPEVVGEPEPIPPPSPVPVPSDGRSDWVFVLIAVAIVTALALVAFVVLRSAGLTAQEAGDTLTPELWLEQILTVLNTITFLPYASALVLLLTAVFKRYVPTRVSTPLIALSFQISVWVLWAIANKLGYEAQFGNLIETLTALLKIIAPLALGIAASTAATHAVHSAAKAKCVPLIGASR